MVVWGGWGWGACRVLLLLLGIHDFVLRLFDLRKEVVKRQGPDTHMTRPSSPSSSSSLFRSSLELSETQVYET